MRPWMVVLLAPAAWRQTTGIGGVVIGTSEVQSPGPAAFQSKLEFDSSDARLVEGFRRARRQALAYVFDGDPVGPWYEAAEPGREAFCMRTRRTRPWAPTLSGWPATT